MNRATRLAFVLLLAAGCQLPPERQPLQLLPEDAPPQNYRELVSRARSQAAAANEAFYVNNWADMEDACRGIEQIARFLPKATDIPATNKKGLDERATQLGKDAGQLRELAKNRDAKQANEVLQRINLRVRELRPDIP